MRHKFIEEYNMLHKIIRLIKEKQTGTPGQLCDFLDINQRKLYKYFNILNDFDCPVKYDRNRKTYYFENGCKLNDFRADD